MSFADSYTLRCGACRARNRIPADKVGQEAKCGKCGGAIDTRVLINARPVMVSDGDFEEKVLRSPLPTLLYCWASWCPGCKQTTPIIDSFAADARGRARVAKLNVDTNPITAAKYDVRSVPYMFVFDNGQMRENLPAVASKHDLMMIMGRYI